MLNKIFVENCLDTMRRMPDGFVDLVVTSPPYNMNLRIRNGQYCSRQIVKEISTKYDNFADNLPIDDFYDLHAKVLTELLRVSDLVFYNIQIVTGSKRAFFKLIGEFSDYLKEIIVWDKGHGQPAMQSQVLNRRSELILVFDKNNAISRKFEAASFARGTLDDIWLITREFKKNNFRHGATFPEKLVEIILTNFSASDAIVYDPFLGTGTTALVAKRLNRNFVGSELSQGYVDVAVGRLKSEGFDV